jgi:hypothetical protein
MKIKNSLKGFLCLSAFAVSYLGFSGSKKTVNIAGEKITTVSIAMAFQAQAYCNEAMYPGEINNGKCSGTASDANSRCFTATSGENCTGAHVPN